jgi:chromosome segregation ATPase
MDVLTERIMEVESRAAQEKIQLVEVQANCSALQKDIAVARGELAAYEERCREFVERQQGLEADKVDLSKGLKLAQREAENLATLIERHRLSEEKEEYSTKRRQSRGFFAWLFGFGQSDDEDWEDLKETARSTLLKALQNERNNVDELETSVASLQANNSAIADQVESRDAIIDELNSRIAVFEEDKVVLKAALRQLQKEIKEEAPKTARLLADLEVTREEIGQLEVEIETMEETHVNETAQLEDIIATRDMLLKQSEANLTMIGTYVDKLEERLADFAVARRDIQVRSKALDGLEDQMQTLTSENSKLLEQMGVYDDEHAQLKKLLEEMAIERGRLLKSSQQLTLDQNGTRAENQQLQTSLQSISYQVQEARNSSDDWQRSSRDFEFKLQQQAEDYQQLMQQRSSLDTVSADMNQRIQELETRQEELQSTLRQTELNRDDLVQKLQVSVRACITAEERAMALERNLTMLEESHLQASDKLARALEARKQAEAAVEKMKHSEKTLRQAQQSSRVGSADEKVETTRDETVRSSSTLAAEKHNVTLPASNTNTTFATRSLPPMNRTGGRQPAQGPRRVPSTKENESVVRQVRKFFAKTTQLHGFFSHKPSKSTSKANLTRDDSSKPENATAALNATRPPHGSLPQQRQPPGPGPLPRQPYPHTSGPPMQQREQPLRQAVPLPQQRPSGGLGQGRPPMSGDPSSPPQRPPRETAPPKRQFGGASGETPPSGSR